MLLTLLWRPAEALRKAGALRQVAAAACLISATKLGAWGTKQRRTIQARSLLEAMSEAVVLGLRLEAPDEREQSNNTMRSAIGLAKFLELPVASHGKCLERMGAHSKARMPARKQVRVDAVG